MNTNEQIKTKVVVVTQEMHDKYPFFAEKEIPVGTEITIAEEVDFEAMLEAGSVKTGVEVAENTEPTNAPSTLTDKPAEPNTEAQEVDMYEGFPVVRRYEEAGRKYVTVSRAGGEETFLDLSENKA